MLSRAVSEPLESLLEERDTVSMSPPATPPGPKPKVRVLPPGVMGRDLGTPGVDSLVPGSVWRRGRQRVRVIAILDQERKRVGDPIQVVQFKELNFGSRVRHLIAQAFLNSSLPLGEESP